MQETIRFAFGKSSLGDFILAASDKGVVSLEFVSDPAAMKRALKARFADVQVIESPGELAAVLAEVSRAIEEPRSKAVVPLDLRGTPYEVGVWTMLRDIPA